MEGIVEAMEEAVGAIMEDTLTDTAMAITGDMDMDGGVILIGGAILIGGVTVIGGVILTGGVILIGGTTLTIPTMIPTTIPIMMKATGNRRCFQKGVPLWQNRASSNLPIGTSVKTQRVTTPMLKIARVVG